MTRSEYTAQVQSALRRVTKREREAIRAEIDAHMEDHICGLLELGYSPELAEERTMAFMGDPAEVGRELNKQYPLRWLVVKWAAMALTLATVLLVLSPAWQFAGQVTDNLWNRFDPQHQLDLCDVNLYKRQTGTYQFLKDASELDLRQTEAGVTMRVYQAGLKCPTAKKTEAWVSVCLYSENPFHQLPQLQYWGVVKRGRILSDQEVAYTFFDGAETSFAVCGQVRRGEDLQFTYEQCGHRYTFSVPLPWEEP